MDDDRDEPREPKRTRWGRILGLLLLGVVVAIVGGHWLWGSTASGRLERLAAEYRARGEPVEPGDFVVTGVADEDNAVLDLRAAAGSIDKTTDAMQAFNRLDYRVPLRDEEVATLRAVVAENAAALEHIERASRKTGVDWQLRFASPMIGTLLPDLSHQRNLARLVTADALLAHHDGDDARALARVGQAMFIGRAVDRQPVLVCHLVAVGISTLAADALGQVTPELRIGAGEATTRGGAASSNRVRELIAMLLDDRPQVEGRRLALLGERMNQLDACRSLGRAQLTLGQVGGAGPGGGGGGGIAAIGNVIGSYVVRPIAAGDGVIMMKHTTALLAAAEASPDAGAYARQKPPMPPEVMSGSVRHVVARLMMPSLDRAAQTDYRAMAERRLVAVALAARLYAAEHDGRLPQRLEDLVPAYLPSVPADTVADGAPLRYVPDPEQPIVYSIGGNGLDDGGSDRPTKPGQDHGRWSWQDAVLHLRTQPRPPPEEERQSDGVGDLGLTTSPTANPSTAPAGANR